MPKEVKYHLKSLLLVGVPVISLSFLFSIFVYLSEKGVNPQFQNYSDTVWWWISTISTVGYGDVFPITQLGRIFGSLVIFSSLIIFAIVISQVGNTFRLLYHSNEMGLKKAKFKNHLVVIGYTHLTTKVIDLLKIRYGNIPIVLIDEDLEMNPYSDVHYVRGNPLDRYTMDSANISNSSAVIVLSDGTLHNPDAFSLVVASEIERLNRNVLTVVEISNDSYIDVYRYGKIDYLIKESDLIKGILELDNPSLRFLRNLDSRILSDK